MPVDRCPIAATSALAFLLGVGGAVTKALPALLLAVVAAREPRALARTIAVGLALSAVGDALLEFPSLFLPGLVAFLCAHVAYTIAFARDERRLAWPLAVPAYAWGLAVFAFLGPAQLGDMLVPVLVYMVVINTMMWRAAARFDRPGGAGGAVGAVVFASSDTLVALHQFGGVNFHGRDLAVMLTYWAAQAMIAWAATRARRSRSPTRRPSR